VAKAAPANVVVPTNDHGSSVSGVLRTTAHFPEKLLAIMKHPLTASFVRVERGDVVFSTNERDMLAAIERTGLFKARMFASIVRQLNMYEFRKMPGVRRWRHPHFPANTALVKRKTVRLSSSSKRHSHRRGQTPPRPSTLPTSAPPVAAAVVAPAPTTTDTPAVVAAPMPTAPMPTAPMPTAPMPTAPMLVAPKPTAPVAALPFAGFFATKRVTMHSVGVQTDDHPCHGGLPMRPLFVI
jgi:hypothetical protein